MQVRYLKFLPLILTCIFLNIQVSAFNSEVSSQAPEEQANLSSESFQTPRPSNEDQDEVFYDCQEYPDGALIQTEETTDNPISNRALLEKLAHRIMESGKLRYNEAVKKKIIALWQEELKYSLKKLQRHAQLLHTSEQKKNKPGTQENYYALQQQEIANELKRLEFATDQHALLSQELQRKREETLHTVQSQIVLALKNTSIVSKAYENALATFSNELTGFSSNSIAKTKLVFSAVPLFLKQMPKFGLVPSLVGKGYYNLLTAYNKANTIFHRMSQLPKTLFSYNNQQQKTQVTATPVLNTMNPYATL